MVAGSVSAALFGIRLASQLLCFAIAYFSFILCRFAIYELALSFLLEQRVAGLCCAARGEDSVEHTIRTGRS